MTFYFPKRAPCRRSISKHLASLKYRPQSLTVIHPTIMEFGPIISGIPIATTQELTDPITISTNTILTLSDNEDRFEIRKKSYARKFKKLRFILSNRHDPNQHYKLFIWNGHGSNSMLSPNDQKITITNFPHCDLAICICCSSQLVLGHDLVKNGIVSTYIGATTRVSTKDHNKLSFLIQKHYKRDLPIYQLINHIHNEVKNDQSLLRLWRHIQVIGKIT